jgi:hypothetical protein
MQDLFDLLAVYAAQSHMPRYAKRTAHAVRDFCDWHIRQYGSMPQVSDLTFEMFVRYFHWLGAITTPSTFNLRRHWLKVFCDWAVTKGLLTSNPIDGVPCAKRPLSSVVRR